MRKFLYEKLSLLNSSLEHRLNLNAYDLLKIGFCCLILMPIRIVCFAVLFIVTFILSAIITYGLSDKELQNRPFTGWRKALRKVIEYFGQAMYFCLGFHYVKINGKQVTKQEAPILIVLPHLSFFDVFVLFKIGLPSLVVSEEVNKIPLVGTVLKAMQPIFLTEDSNNTMNLIEELKERSRPKNDWPQIIVFPALEGTCTDQKCFISSKTSAFLPGLPLQPVTIQYKNKFDNLTCVGSNKITKMKAFFYPFHQIHSYLEITVNIAKFQTFQVLFYYTFETLSFQFLPVYHPNLEERIDVELFTNNIQNRIVEHLISKDGNHINDTKANCLAFGLNDFEKIRDSLGIKYKNSQEIFEKFVQIARISKGRINLDDLLEYLDLPVTEDIKQFFSTYDRDNNGHIDFRQFLIGMSVLSQPVNNEKTLRIAFELFDLEDKGFICLPDFQLILFTAFSMEADEVAELFDRCDTNRDGLISFEEFKVCAMESPAYARMFLSYPQIKELEKCNGEIWIDKLPKIDEEDENDYAEEDLHNENDMLRHRLNEVK